MPSFSRVLLLILLIGLSSCFKADKKSQEDVDKNSGSSFIVGEVTGRSDVLPEDLDPVLKYPKARTYKFSACVKNWVTDAKLYGQKFIVTDGKRDYPATMTDTDRGCFSWEEKVPYNYLADSTYVELQRSIKGDGVNRGRVDIPIAVMPWVQDRGLKELEVRDLRQSYKALPAGTPVARGNQDVDYALKGLNKTGEAQKANAYVWVEEVSTDNVSSIDKTGGGLITNITINKLQVRYRDAQGVIRLLPLRDGKFRIVPTYISAQTVNGVVERRVISQLSEEEVSKLEISTVRDGILRARVHMKVPLQCTFGELELGIKVQPIGMNSDIGDFEGVFLVGECDRIVGYAMARIRESVKREEGKSFSLDNWLTTEAKGLKNNRAYDGYKKVHQFDFSSVALRFLGVENETVTERTIQYRGTTCIKDPFNRKPIEGLNFKISRVEDDGTLVPLTEDRKKDDIGPGGDRTQKADACLNWVDKLRHKYYIPERYFKRTIEIEHIRSGNKHRLTIAINPWDYGFTFGHDVSDLGEKYFNQMNDKVKPKSYMILYNYRYETIRFRYEIDKFMTLKVKKTVLLRIDPRVIRYSSITFGQERNEPLRDGYYLMKTAFQKDYLDQEGRKVEYIDASKSIVLVRSGVLVTPVELEVTDLRLMRLRSNFLIELEPIDERRLGISASHPENFQKIDKKFDFDNYQLNPEESGLPPRTFVGPIIALSNYFGAGMRPTDELQEVLCETPNCDQMNLDETLPEHEKDRDLAKYYGKLSHLENVSVSQLIKRKKEEIEPHYLKRMGELSSYGNFLNSLNLEYLQLKNPENIAEKLPGAEIESINRVIPSKNMPDYFLKEMNSRELWQRKSGVVMVQKPTSHPPPGLYQRVPPIAMDDMMSMINTNLMIKPNTGGPTLGFGQKVDRSMRTRLCHYWFDSFLPKSVGMTREQLFGKQSSGIDRMVTRCVVNGGINALAEVFDATQMLRVGKIADYNFKRGMSLNMQIGADIKMNHTEDYKTSMSVNFKPLVSVSNLFRDVFGTDFNIQWSKGESDAHSEGKGFGDSINLVVQIAKFNIVVDNYERCSYLKMKPSFLKSIDFFEHISSANNKLTYEDAINLSSRGLMVCSGEPIVGQPLTVRENYYYFTQMFNDGDMLDLGDQKNHPWLLALRGTADYSRFVRLMMDMKVLDKIQGAKALFNQGDERDILGGLITGGLSSDETHEKFKADAGTKKEDLWKHYGSVLGFDPVKHLQWKTAQPNKKSVDEVLDSEKERKFRALEYKELSGMRGAQIPIFERDMSKVPISDMQIRKSYELGDFPVRHAADAYSSTLPTFPGFIVITEDSLRTNEAY